MHCDYLFKLRLWKSLTYLLTYLLVYNPHMDTRTRTRVNVNAASLWKTGLMIITQKLKIGLVV